MRKTTQVVLFLVCLNAAAGAIQVSGVDSQIGMAPEPGGDEHLEEANESATQFSPGNSGEGTLFGALTGIASALGNVFVLATVGGPLMFLNLGFPVWAVTFLFSPMYIIAALDIMYAISGRDI